MQLVVDSMGKRYGKQWLFRSVHRTFEQDNPTAIVAPNGFGKSTFIKLLAGVISPNEGSVRYINDDEEIPNENWYMHHSFSGPYVSIPGELTLRESVAFHLKLKPSKLLENPVQFGEFIGLEKHLDKSIGDFSSGMKQRVKLGLCFIDDGEVLLLDEPINNLDKQGVEWYQSALREASQNKIVIISSNDIKAEFFLCNEIIKLDQFKP